MNKYNKGSTKILITVIFAVILVAVISFYAGSKFTYRNMVMKSMVEKAPTQDSGLVNTEVQTVDNQVIDKPVITDKAIVDYYNDPSRQDVKMIYNVIKPGFISAKSTQYPTMEELTVLARGDIDLDGYEDVVLHLFSCGASCANGLKTILNDKKGGIVEVMTGFPDQGYKPSYTNASISNGILTITGSSFNSEGTSKSFVKKYKFSGGEFIEVK